MRFKDKYVDDFDAVLLSKGERQKPDKEWIEYGKMPGSSLALYQDTETFKPYQRTVVILSKDLTQLPDIYQWLDGSGELEIDDGGYYKARVLTVTSETESLMLGWTRVIATFELQPFLYLPSETVTLIDGGTVWNPGIESDPYFKITGVLGALTVNGVSYTVSPIDGYVEIEFPFAWKGLLNKGKTISGFPKLKPGANVISWTGLGVTIEMNGRWRTL